MAYDAPPPGGYPGTPQFDEFGNPLSDKSKLVAGLLGILLGGFGAGRFYTGHTGIAIAQLGVSIVTCGIGAIWGVVDGIMILVNGGTDAQGRKLRD
ncbi:MAG: TM2 domain-containing protein [Micromonosporaceae bacterium]|nr:TM2 domain-containing protein [Micromonosporaceae bacterium]